MIAGRNNCSMSCRLEWLAVPLVPLSSVDSLAWISVQGPGVRSYATAEQHAGGSDYCNLQGMTFYWCSINSAGLMPPEARGNYLPQAPYLHETKTYVNYMPASESTLDSGTSGKASHSSRHDMLQLFRPAINTAHFYFCCRSYVKLLDY